MIVTNIFSRERELSSIVFCPSAYFFFFLTMQVALYITAVIALLGGTDALVRMHPIA